MQPNSKSEHLPEDNEDPGRCGLHSNKRFDAERPSSPKEKSGSDASVNGDGGPLAALIPDSSVIAHEAGVDRPVRRAAYLGDSRSSTLTDVRHWALNAAPVGADRDDVALVVSELVANVFLYAPGPFAVGIFVTFDKFVLVAADPGGDRIPTMASPSISQPSGRGLRIVSRLTEDWGTIIGPKGKCVWSRFPLNTSVPVS